MAGIVGNVLSGENSQLLFQAVAGEIPREIVAAEVGQIKTGT